MGNRRKIYTVHEEQLREFMISNPDATLDEPRSRLFEEEGLNDHLSTVGRVLDYLNLTRKKKSSSQ